MAGFLEYVPGKSFIHRMNPVFKVICALLFSIACFCTSNLIFLALALVIDFVLAARCHLMREALGLAKAVSVFSLVLALIALFTTSTGNVLITLPWGYIGTGSVFAAVVIIMRLVACAIPIFLVMYVTKLTDMANAFCKMLKVPYRYAFMFTSAVRFIPLFMNDMAGIMEAQTARGVEFDGSIAKRLRLMVPLCVPLLVSSVRKTGSAAIAAEVRGFNLRTCNAGYKEYPIAARDMAALIVCIALLAAACIISLLL